MSEIGTYMLCILQTFWIMNYLQELFIQAFKYQSDLAMIFIKNNRKQSLIWLLILTSYTAFLPMTANEDRRTEVCLVNK